MIILINIYRHSAVIGLYLTGVLPIRQVFMELEQTGIGNHGLFRLYAYEGS